MSASTELVPALQLLGPGYVEACTTIREVMACYACAGCGAQPHKEKLLLSHPAPRSEVFAVVGVIGCLEHAAMRPEQEDKNMHTHIH